MLKQIYESIPTHPSMAIQIADELLSTASEQATIDQLNWAKAYAYVELKDFNKALSIWDEIYQRTKSHKALHQIGFVYREQGRHSKALAIYLEEQSQISKNDILAIAVNLYELSFCYLLLNQLDSSLHYFEKYSAIQFEEIDQIERACFFRLKGDIYKNINPNIARSAYEESCNHFQLAEDEIGVNEIKLRLSNLD